LNTRSIPLNRWLSAVVDEAAREGLALTTLDDALERYEPPPLSPEAARVSSWGEGGDLRTWSGPAAASLAWLTRTAELRLLAAPGKPPARALRELLALQASDWAFLTTGALAGEYPVERAQGHAEGVLAALADPSAEPALRNLAPDLCGWVDR
jgi:1,4-alpha-glucan branching enzyme